MLKRYKCTSDGCDSPMMENVLNSDEEIYDTGIEWVKVTDVKELLEIRIANNQNKIYIDKSFKERIVEAKEILKFFK